MAFRCFSPAQAVTRPRVIGMCFLLTQLSSAVHIRDGEKDVQMIIDGAGDAYIDGVYHDPHGGDLLEPPQTMANEENAPESPLEPESGERTDSEKPATSDSVPIRDLAGALVLGDRIVFRRDGGNVSFESVEEMKVLFCQTPIQLDLRNTKARYSNLGKHGPSDGLSAEGILIPNVFPGGARKLDLDIEAIGPYYPSNVSMNGMQGHFVDVNVEAGSFVELRVSIVDQQTNMGPPDLPPWMVTLVDIDQQRPEHGGTEYIAVEGFEYFVVTNDTEVEVGQDELGRSTFLSTEYGVPADNPVHNSRQMTDFQLSRSVSFIFNGSTTSFFLRFHTYEGWFGRNLLFTGVSNMLCPRTSDCTDMTCPADYVPREGGEFIECKGPVCSEENDLLSCCEASAEPTRAFCTAMECPPGQTQVEDASQLFCAFEACTSGDAELCCEFKHEEACSTKGFISFQPGSLMYSNLGGKGPEFLSPQGIHIRDVFPYRHEVIDLIATNVTEYRTSPDDSEPSGLVDDMLYVDVAAGHNVTLNFKFIVRGVRTKGGGPHSFDPAKEHSDVTHSFYLTYSKIDGNATSGIKSVTTYPVSHYNLSNETYVIPTEVSPGNMKFAADGSHQVKTPSNLAKDFAFNKDFENAIVGVFYEKVTSFNLTLAVAGGPAAARRTFLIGGLDTPIECKKKARCDTMYCPAGFTRVEAAHMVECAGEVCSQDDLAMCCFPLEEDFCRTRFGFYLNQVYTNVSSNLGGLGPHRGAFRGIIIRDAFPNFEEVIDMEITNTTPYDLAKLGPRRNSINGETLNIHVRKGTKVGLKFRLLKGNTKEPVEDMFAYLVSFLDLLGDASGFGLGITMHNFTEYYVEMNTLLHVDSHSFSAGDWTPKEDAGEPEAGLAVNSEHLLDIVSFKQGPNVSTFHVTLDASSKGEVEPGPENVIFKILGPTRVNCPAREACDTFICPKGYATRTLEYPTYCQGERCTTEDVMTCCMLDTCQDTRRLNFKKANQRWNNLGGHGPQYVYPPSIMIDKVFAYDQTISVNISVDGLYFPGNVSLNGLDDKDVANVNIHTGSDVRLRISFINATTNKSITTEPFLFSVGDIDEQRDHGGHESAEIWPLPEELFVARGLSFDVQYPNRFNARTFGSGVDNMNGSWAEENAMQENHSVSVLMPALKEMFLDVHVTPGWAGRNIHFGGADKLACPPPGPPSWMKSGGRLPVPFEDDGHHVEAEGQEAESQKYVPREIDPVPTDPFDGK